MLFDLNGYEAIKVLNDGFVALDSVFGTDEDIVKAARVSYGQGTVHTSDERTLLRYLMRHRHTTPFEMVEMKFIVRVPMDTWRQWIRHRAANVNEYSTRYSEAIDSTYVTDEWRVQSKTNKQGSGSGTLVWPESLPDLERTKEQFASPEEFLSMMERQLHKLSRQVYGRRLEAGVAREQARKDLPLSTYTEAYWKCDMHNLLHFLGLRLDSHAQKEIRDYANAIAYFVEKKFPLTWEAFQDYRLDAVTLTGPEIRELGKIRSRAFQLSQQVLTREEASRIVWSTALTNREITELIDKLVRLGFVQD